MEPFVLRAGRPVPHLGILEGDRIVFDPDAEAMVTLWRGIPNVGAVLGAYEEGALKMLTPPSGVLPCAEADPPAPLLRRAFSAHALRLSRLALIR